MFDYAFQNGELIFINEAFLRRVNSARMIWAGELNDIDTYANVNLIK